MNKGWICIHRCILKHWIWQDANRFKWWVDLLLRANHEDKKVLIDGSLKLCKRGELITSLSKLASEWMVNRDTVRRFLDLLESDNMITRISTHKMTQITICNYDSYQDRPTTDTTTDASTEATTDRQLTQQQADTNNNYNNDNNIDNSIIDIDSSKNKDNNKHSYGGGKPTKATQRFIPPTLEEVKAYCQERGNSIDPERFIDHYTANGWVVGKSKAKMKDWKASVRTWEKLDTKPAKQVTLGVNEWMDGDRRTYGSGKITVPSDAPPRPSEQHAWSKANNKWII